MEAAASSGRDQSHVMQVGPPWRTGALSLRTSTRTVGPYAQRRGGALRTPSRHIASSDLSGCRKLRLDLRAWPVKDRRTAACRSANCPHRSPSTAFDQPSASIECFTGSESCSAQVHGRLIYSLQTLRRTSSRLLVERLPRLSLPRPFRTCIASTPSQMLAGPSPCCL